MKLPWSREQRLATAVRQVTPANAGGRTNLVAPTPTLATPRSLGAVTPRRFASIVVGASDSNVVDSEVDFRCSGTDDNVVVDQAIAYADSLNIGAVNIRFLCGSYHFSAAAGASANEAHIFTGEAVNQFDPSGVVIDGDNTGSGFVAIYEGCRFLNMAFKDCDVAVELQAANFLLDELSFDNVNQPVLMTQSGSPTSSYVWYGARIKNLHFGNSCGNGAGSYLIDLNWTHDFVYYLEVAGCQVPGFFSSISGAMRLKNTATSGSNLGGYFVRIHGNGFEYGILVDGWDTVSLDNNTFDFTDVEMRNIGQLSMVGNLGIDDLTLNTVNQFAHAGNIVTGSYSETAVTTKAGVSIGIT